MAEELTESKVIGCILGVALGDAYGAPYEGGVLERGLWRLIQAFSKDLLYTDDTQTTMDVINSMVKTRAVNADDIALKMSESYTWLKGYGQNTAKILKRIRRGAYWHELNESVFKGGSFGNGAAIRTSPIGLLFSLNVTTQKAQLREVSRQVASITHSHELGMQGAYLFSLAVALVIYGVGSHAICEELLTESRGSPFEDKIKIVVSWLSERKIPETRLVRKRLGNGMSALESVITAIYLALSHFDLPAETLLKQCIALKGDTDSIASMACFFVGGEKWT